MPFAEFHNCPVVFPKAFNQMHVLQPKHTKLKSTEVKKLLEKYNISLSQLPKIKISDSALLEGCVIGDVIEIERKSDDKVRIYYRVVVE